MFITFTKTTMKVLIGTILHLLYYAAPILSQSISHPNPVIDGIITQNEWKKAQSHGLRGEGKVLILSTKGYLYIAVVAETSGLASLCIAGHNHVKILHASAALGSVSYTRKNTIWLLHKPFQWQLRDTIMADSSIYLKQKAFFLKYGWIANASYTQTPIREFRIKLEPEYRHIAIVFLEIEKMKTSYWPKSINNACRNLDLLLGKAPDSLHFKPSLWVEIR